MADGGRAATVATVPTVVTVVTGDGGDDDNREGNANNPPGDRGKIGELKRTRDETELDGTAGGTEATTEAMRDGATMGTAGEARGGGVSTEDGCNESRLSPFNAEKRFVVGTDFSAGPSTFPAAVPVC